ncbi:hypothetical protein LXL04_015713 [Taraxacum kok-saghyz]
MLGESRENDTNHTEGGLDEECSNVYDGFSSLLEEARSGLYPGCTYSRHTTKDMIWHNTRGSEEGTMRQPVDGTALKDLDMKLFEESGNEVVELDVGPTPATLNEESDGETDYDGDEGIHGTALQLSNHPAGYFRTIGAIGGSLFTLVALLSEALDSEFLPFGCKLVLLLLLLLATPKPEPLKIFENHGEAGFEDRLKATKMLHYQGTFILEPLVYFDPKTVSITDLDLQAMSFASFVSHLEKLIDMRCKYLYFCLSSEVWLSQGIHALQNECDYSEFIEAVTGAR